MEKNTYVDIAHGFDNPSQSHRAGECGRTAVPLRDINEDLLMDGDYERDPDTREIVNY